MHKYYTSLKGTFPIASAIGGMVILFCSSLYLPGKSGSNLTGLNSEFPWAFLFWLLIAAACIYVIQKRLLKKGCKPDPTAVFRSVAAGIVFCVTVSASSFPNQPRLLFFSTDLTFYFLINTVAYAMLIYGLFSSRYAKQLSGVPGKYFLLLTKLHPAYWLIFAFIWIFAAANYLSWELFQHFPWVDDTIVQLVHAKFIAAGHWYLPSHPLREFFHMIWMINDGKWYSQYPPGHVLLLAIGVIAGHPEMVNPFLGACTSFAVYLLAKEVYGIYVAKIAALLSALCAYLVIFSSEYMNNATSLLMGTLFLWAYIKVLNHAGWRYALIAGVVLGYCFITRPYSAFAIALPPAIYAGYLSMARGRAYLAPMAIIVAAFSYFLLFQLYYNSITTGNAFKFGYQTCMGINPCEINQRNWYNPLSSDAWEILTPQQLYLNLRYGLQRASYLNRILFEWPVPALGLVALVYALRGHRRNDRLLFMTVLSVCLSCQFIRNIDSGWGPRLWYEITGILLVFCAKAVTLLPVLLRKLSLPQSYFRLPNYYGAGIIILLLFYGFSLQYNFKISTIKNFYELNGREGNPEFYATMNEQVTPPALVFVPRSYYKFVSFTNPPTEDSPIIFAQNLGSRNNELIQHYPLRNVYIVGFNKSGLVTYRIK